MIAIAACFRIEARWVRRTDGLRVVKVPMGQRASDGLSASLSGEDPRILISAGVSGGLTTSVRLGDIAVARTIEHQGMTIRIDERLIECAEAAMHRNDRRWSIGDCLCTDAVVCTAEEKAALGQSGAIAVDMESGPLARWAEEHDVPFLSVRVILDPVEMALPFSQDLPLWRSVLAHPVAAVRVGRMARVAGRALGAALNDVADVLREAP
jgi:nucleoside phosphorylase